MDIDNNNEDSVIIIMAAGLGKRMNSSIPKILHLINNKPMLVRVIEAALKLNPHKICIVVGKYFNKIQRTIEQYLYNNNDNHNNTIRTKIAYILQLEPRGTGHAISCCKSYLETTPINIKKITVLSGDVPLITYKTLNTLLKSLKSANILIANIDDPTGYGRIVLENNKIIKIIEEKDCSAENKNISLINSGIYAFDKTILLNYIDKLDDNNAQKELYLTQIFELLNTDNIEIDYTIVENHNEILGVNNLNQLNHLNQLNQLNQLNK